MLRANAGTAPVASAAAINWRRSSAVVSFRPSPMMLSYSRPTRPATGQSGKGTNDLSSSTNDTLT